MHRIYLSPPHLGKLEQEYVQEAFDSNWIAPAGPYIDAFENEFAGYIGVKYAAALSSGTAALHLALKILGIKEGDAVYCSDLTFAASANVIRYERANPVFIDVDPETWNMNPDLLALSLRKAAMENQLPKAVIAVNLYGQSADYDPIQRVCHQYRVPLIEDAAESLGATYKGKQTGNFGDLAVFSFNGNKIITTSGGGMLVSNTKDYIDQARFLSTEAKDPAPHYEHSQLGYNYRMSNVLAGIGRGQLTVLNHHIEARRLIFQRYYDALTRYDGVDFMPEAPYGRSTRWLTTLTVDPEQAGCNRTDIIKALQRQDIEARPVWKPMHLQPLYKEFKFMTFENGESISGQLFNNGLCLPSGSNLSKEDQDRVINTVQDCLKG